MRIEIHRQKHLDKQTLGYLYIVDENDEILFSCDTLELPWKENKKNISCVPLGNYKCVLEYSARFKKDLWELKKVPNRSECKFHSANYFYQLNGCIALGNGYDDIDNDNWTDVLNSKDTMKEFHELLIGLTEINLHIE